MNLRLTVIVMPLLMASLATVPVCGQGDESEEKIIPFETRSSALLGVSPRLRIETGQDDLRLGIRFSVEIVNDSDRELVLARNPLDSIHYAIFREGKELGLRSRGVRFLNDPRRPPDLKPQGFRVARILLDGQDVTEREEWRDSLRLPAGSVYVMELTIEKTRRSTEDWTPTPITSGTYRMSFVLGLIPESEGRRIGYNSGAVVVRLGSN